MMGAYGVRLSLLSSLCLGVVSRPFARFFCEHGGDSTVGRERGDSGILVSGGLPVLCVGNLLWNGSKAEGAHTRGVSSFESGS